jgi:hypothetical protein
VRLYSGDSLVGWAGFYRSREGDGAPWSVGFGLGLLPECWSGEARGSDMLTPYGPYLYWEPDEPEDGWSLTSLAAVGFDHALANVRDPAVPDPRATTTKE